MCFSPKEAQRVSKGSTRACWQNWAVRGTVQAVQTHRSISRHQFLMQCILPTLVIFQLTSAAAASSTISQPRNTSEPSSYHVKENVDRCCNWACSYGSYQNGWQAIFAFSLSVQVRSSEILYFHSTSLFPSLSIA